MDKNSKSSFPQPEKVQLLNTWQQKYTTILYLHGAHTPMKASPEHYILLTFTNIICDSNINYEMLSRIDNPLDYLLEKMQAIMELESFVIWAVRQWMEEDLYHPCSNECLGNITIVTKQDCTLLQGIIKYALPRPFDMKIFMLLAYYNLSICEIAFRLRKEVDFIRMKRNIIRQRLKKAFLD